MKIGFLQGLKQSSGFTAIQALISLDIVMATAFATLTSLTDIQKNQSRSTAGSARSSISSVLTFNATNPLAIYVSSEYAANTLNDPRLRACVCGETTCLANAAVDFNLLDVSGSIISGTDNSKRKFDLLGNFCQHPPCVFEATSNFACLGSHCGTYVTSSGDPLLRISYQLYLTDDIRGQRAELTYLKEAKESFEVPVSAVKRYGLENDVCVSGTTVTPTYGLSFGGQQVTIVGTGLQRVSQVLFDNSSCTIVSGAKKSLSCVTPAHSDGYVNVSLKYAPNQTFVIPNAFQYYTPPPPEPPPPAPSSPSGPLCHWSQEAVFGPCTGTPSGMCYPCGGTAQACGVTFSCIP